MKTRATTSLIVLTLACAQAREAEDPSRAQAQASEGAADPEGQGAEGQGASEGSDGSGTGQGDDAASTRASGEPGGDPTAQKKGRIAGGNEDPGEVPVASSPSGLLKPGAEQKIRDQLGVKDRGSLRGALQKFQQEHDLPATGILDDRTVESLGLDPDDVFERARSE